MNKWVIYEAEKKIIYETSKDHQEYEKRIKALIIKLSL